MVEGGLVEDITVMDAATVDFVYKATEKKVVAMEGCRKRVRLGRQHQHQGIGGGGAIPALVVPASSYVNKRWYIY